MKSPKLVAAVFKLPEEVKEWAEQEAIRLSQQNGMRHTLSDILRAALNEWRKNQERRNAHWKASGRK